MEFRPMRRGRQQLTNETCEEILRNATSGTLALLGDGDYPYAVPLSFVYADGIIYFHSAQSGHKIDAIHHHDKASFCVIAMDEIHGNEFTTYFRSVIAFGRITIVSSPDEKLEGVRLLGRKYNPDDEAALSRELEKGLAHMEVLRFDIEYLSGKEAIELSARTKYNYIFKQI